MIPSHDDLAALALGAVDDDERVILESLLADDPARQELLRALSTTAAGLGGLVTQAPPPELWDKILSSARQERAPGRFVGMQDGDRITESEALRRSIDEFTQLLQGLGADDWLRPVPTYGRVRDLVAHLVAIEEYVGGQFGLWPGVADPAAGHVAISEAAISEWANRPVSALADEWTNRAHAVLEYAQRATATDLDSGARWHAAEVSRRALLVIRTFELWAHGDDIRRALELPEGPLDTGRLVLMTEFAVLLVPTALGICGHSHSDRTARLVLTGTGGGTWNRVLRLEPAFAENAPPDVVIVADAVDFCRVATRRLSPDDLEVSLDGDEDLGREILACLGALAAD
jgi:uncharacterized protein (TIGR03083 family)